MIRLAITFVCLGLFSVVQGQNYAGYWQQHADYTMDIDVDVEKGTYKGSQTLVYTNNSPDVLDKVYYHLYFNAFQPGSEMDVRSRSIADPDPRVGDRISKLTPDQIGYIKPLKLTQDGKEIEFNVAGTVLEVALHTPIAPGAKATFEMEWDAQVPIQIRRSGRDNAEGVAYSMTQWYPKMAEYDFEGWHAYPYIGREFHGVWGDFDVTVHIDESYVIGGTGYLQPDSRVRRGKKSWHFKAPNVHDFTWAADPDYIHDVYEGPNGVELNFYYKNNPDIIENWKSLQPKTAELMAFFNEKIGPYPYEQYSVIQGGDGGMEYAMCTLITGERKFESLVGVTSHEMAHTWFQFLMATNEGKHEWMDEGFTSYISARAMNKVMESNRENPFQGSYRGYVFLATSGAEQPQSTHADRYATNRAYGISAYSKGAVFMAQLVYVMGQDALDLTLNRYYKDWSFKHPTPTDFIRVAEKESGLHLHWYLTDWTNTINTIDYGIKSVVAENEGNSITLERIGLMPMPIDLKVTYTDGSSEYFYIPLQMMRGEKPQPTGVDKWAVMPDWAWAYPTYDLEVSSGKTVSKVEIDPSGLMADVDNSNNSWPNE
jgi:hypothetical protein